MPLILVSNDDGIRAEGLRRLAEVLSELGEVVVVAPARQQSAASHKITLDRPLRIRQVADGWTAVSGTPADSVFLALANVLAPRKPDLVVSGINNGLNIGRDVFYSGTVAAAMEAAMKGFPAMAVSQQLAGLSTATSEMLDHAASFAKRVARAMLEAPPPAGICLNVNLPRQANSVHAWTTVGDRVYGGNVIERVDPRGGRYYWIGGASPKIDGPPGTDARAIRDGVISISAIAADWNTSLPTEQRHWESLLEKEVAP